MSGFSADELKKKVIESYGKKEWPVCIDACRELNEMFPDNLSVALKLGEIYGKAGDRDSAIDTYRGVAERYTEAGDFLKAVGVYKMILDLSPGLDDVRKKMEELCSPRKAEVWSGTLPDIPLLSELEEEELVRVVESLRYIRFDMGEIICREGEAGDSIYIVAGGSVKVFVEGVAGEKIEITHLGEGDFFGEVGFFTDGIRHASVMALDDTDILEITKEEFKKIVGGHPGVGEKLERFYRMRVLDKLIAFSPIFSTLKEKDRHQLVERFNLRSFNEGDTVIREGDAGDALFIIKSGHVEVSTEASGKKIVLAELKEGEFFGEVSLITGKKRTATVTASTAVELMELSKKDLMGLSEKYPKIKEVLERYRKVRVDSTVNKIMALKEMDAREGLV